MDPSFTTVSEDLQSTDIESSEDSDDEDLEYLSCSEDDKSVHSEDRSRPYLQYTGSTHTLTDVHGQQSPDAFDAERDASTYATSNVFGNSDNDPSTAPDIDLSNSIKGMYRILDLVSEQGSGGLVDKIIIAQDSLREFINEICPGAYVSLTKVKFKILDNLAIKPMGVYGSKEEIAKFLVSIGAADDATMTKLLEPQDGASGPTLRSGIYIVRSFNTSVDDEQLYVLYWPQDTTWDDSAVDSIRRNRVAFMRYLTKMCDQIVALISPEHAEGITWADDNDDYTSTDADIEESDRVFKFEVAKTKEQEENVSVQPGFQVISPEICIKQRPKECVINEEIFTPKLLFGETSQGFITAEYLSAEKYERFSHRDVTSVFIRNTLKSGALRFDQNLDEQAMMTLVKNGLNDRFPALCKVWSQDKEATRKMLAREDTNIKVELAHSSSKLENTLREAIVDVIVKTFPTFSRKSLGCPSPIEGNDVDNATAHFLELTERHPKIRPLFEKTIRDEGLNKITSQPFRNLELKLVVANHLQHQQYLDPALRQSMIKSVLNEHRADTTITKIKNLVGSFVNLVTEGSLEDKLIQDARDNAANISDADFLSCLGDIRAHGEPFQSLVADTENIVINHWVTMRIPRLLKNLYFCVQRIQEDEFTTRIRLQTYSREETDRTNFIRAIEQQSQSYSNSRVRNINSLQSRIQRYGSVFDIEGWLVSHRNPEVEFTVHLMSLTAEHKQEMQLDPTYIPSPYVERRLSHSFRLSVNRNIIFSQLLENENLCLVVTDRDGTVLIFVQALAGMASAIERGKFCKKIHRDRIGQDFILCYDECKRMLVLCSSTKAGVISILFSHANILSSLNFMFLYSTKRLVLCKPWLAASVYHSGMIMAPQSRVPASSLARKRWF